MRFVQFSDVHLDSRISRSMRLPDDLCRTLRRDLRTSFGRACDLAVEQSADLVLIAGDLFDYECVDSITGSFLADALASVAPARVFISPGNHDSLRAGSPYTESMREMQRVLRQTYSYALVDNPFTTSGKETRDGFERLYAELLVMLGDESYTAAFASRFDLAGSAMLSFPGQQFEGENGLNLSGGAGYEMYVLYQAAQYYEMALERFYRTAPLLWKAIELGEVNGFVTAETVSSYFKALARASTQKAAAYAEIAKRYQSFNRPELARQVVERAYAGAYLESIVLSNVLAKVRTVAGSASKPEIAKNLEEAAGRYRSAMLSMRDLYESITDQVNYFGFPAEYVPSPSLNPTDANIFEKQLSLAKDRLLLAAKKEAVALANNRSFETDAVAFQNELSKLQSSYEDQLAEICGTFRGADGKVYPATPAYVYLLPTQMHIPDPCGLVANGGIHDALGEVALAAFRRPGACAGGGARDAAATDRAPRPHGHAGGVLVRSRPIRVGSCRVRLAPRRCPTLSLAPGTAGAWRTPVAGRFRAVGAQCGGGAALHRPRPSRQLPGPGRLEGRRGSGADRSSRATGGRGQRGAGRGVRDQPAAGLCAVPR